MWLTTDRALSLLEVPLWGISLSKIQTTRGNFSLKSSDYQGEFLFLKFRPLRGNFSLKSSDPQTTGLGGLFIDSRGVEAVGVQKILEKWHLV